MPATDTLPMAQPSLEMERPLLHQVYGNPDLDRLTRLVGKTLHVPMVYLVMADLRGQTTISTFGMSPLALAEIILPKRGVDTMSLPYAVDDLSEPGHPLYQRIASRLGAVVQGAVPLVSSSGQPLGILCALDTQDRQWEADENVILGDFAQLVVTEVELTTKVVELEQFKTALAEKNEVLRTLIDTSPDYIFVKDTEGRFIISNRAHAQAAGIADPELLIGKTASETFPEELAEQYNSDDASVVQSGEPLINIERQTLDSGGERRWVLTSKVPLLGGDGKLRGLVGISRDITARKLAEETLRDREAFIQQVIATSPSLIYLYDLVEQRIIYSNVEIFEILGYTPDEIRALGSRLFVTLMHPEDLAHLPERMEQLKNLKDGEILDREYRMKHRHGEYRWLYSREVIFKRDGGGNPMQTLGTVLDITRMKTAEAALRESELRMRTLVNAAPVVLIEMNVNAIITVAEGEGIRRLGREPNSLLGCNGFDMLHTLFGSEYRIAQRLKSAVEGEPVDFIHDNGDVVFHLRFAPSFHLTTFKVSGVTIVGIDVTEQVRARDALVDINGRLSKLRKIDTDLNSRLDQAHVIQTALQSVISESGAARGCIAVVDGDSLQVRAVLGDVPGDKLLANAHDSIERVLNDGRACIHTLDGREVSAQLAPGSGLRTVLPLTYGEKISGVIVLENPNTRRHDEDTFEFVKSITLRAAAALENARLYAHLNQLYERVSALEQLKTDMIRIAAHDLRNPLTSIKGYLTLLAHDMAETLTSRQQDYLMMLERTAQSMQRIISEILSLQRIEAIHDDVELSPVDLALLVQEQFERNEEQAEQQQVALQMEVGESPIYILGDEAQLREAIDNLVHNAIKYTPAGGHVFVRLDKRHDRLHFEVEDTGYGIPIDQQARLFQPFYRARSTATRHIEGTGLGLHLVKKIIERHKGQMLCSSVEGKGSTFGFELALLDVAPTDSNHR